jgi:predicted O-methyltransferase YrrM
VIFHIRMIKIISWLYRLCPRAIHQHIFHHGVITGRGGWQTQKDVHTQVVSRMQIRSKRNNQAQDTIVIFCPSGEARIDEVGHSGAEAETFLLWVNLLNKHGVQAYMILRNSDLKGASQFVTNIESVLTWRKECRELRFVCGIHPDRRLLDITDELYFLDTRTLNYSYKEISELRHLLKKKCISLATSSQAKILSYLPNLGIVPQYIPRWADNEFWRSDPAKRVSGRVGYMRTGLNGDTELDVLVEEVSDYCKDLGCVFDFVEIQGSEEKILSQMQTCDYYLGADHDRNCSFQGATEEKQLEALHVGCVLVAYESAKNRDFAIKGFSAMLTPADEREELARTLAFLHMDPVKRERLRINGQALAYYSFSPDSRWDDIKRFLGIAENATVSENLAGLQPAYISNATELSHAITSPAFLTTIEIKLLAKYAQHSSCVIMEIGSAFGASTVVLLLNSPETAQVHSIDPFVKDSMSDFIASGKICRGNVYSALRLFGQEKMIQRWSLHETMSGELAKRWNEKIDLLFIDGDHRYAAVRRDFLDWFPFIRVGGVIMLHDSRRHPNDSDNIYARGWKGPSQLANELRKLDVVKCVEQGFSLTIWRKVREASLSELI